MDANTEALRRLTQRWFREVWRELREETLRELLHEDSLTHGLTTSNAPPMGRDELIVWWNQMVQAFPDVRVEVEQILVEGDTSAARYEWFGTHQGAMDGVPATGRRARMTGMFFARWEDGRIVESWNNFDHLGLLRQLGLMEG